MSQLRYSTIISTYHRRLNHRHTPFSTSLSFPTRNLSFSTSNAAGGGSGGIHHGGGNGGGGGGGGEHGGGDSRWENFGVLGMFIKGWKERVKVDPQFPFKVVMEEVVGVTSCVIGDMASRPNFGLNELDLVFSTLVVGSILNFTLMYVLAPTTLTLSTSAATSSLLRTFISKGLIFGIVGFGAGLVGTVISNGLTRLRNRMDDGKIKTVDKSPDTLRNAVTWGLHMGLSSNFRYQVLNAVEGALVKTVPSGVFKASVVGLRCANNVLGGVSFVALARLTGSQSVGGGDEEVEAVVVGSGEVDKLVDGVASNQST